MFRSASKLVHLMKILIFTSSVATLGWAFSKGDLTSDIIPFPSPSPRSTYIPFSKLAKTEGEVLLKQFINAQKDEVKGVVQRQRSLMKDLKAAQDIRQKNWEKDERKARYKFFLEHEKGPEKRSYIHDFIRRREEFLKSLAEEKSVLARKSEEVVDELKRDQVEKLAEFKAFIDQGEVPPADLWPIK